MALFARSLDAAFPSLKIGEVVRMQAGDQVILTVIQQFAFPKTLRHSDILAACKPKPDCQGIDIKLYPVHIELIFFLGKTPVDIQTSRRQTASTLAKKFKEMGTTINPDINLEVVPTKEDAKQTLADYLLYVSGQVFDLAVIEGEITVDSRDLYAHLIPKEWEGYPVTTRPFNNRF
jgi:hypothetical protein